MPLISIIITTIEKNSRDLYSFLDSLKDQSFKDFELIFINQTPSVFDFSIYDFDVNQIYSERISLSKARNIGLHVASGEIVSFPDDDCLYYPTLLEKIASFFEGSTHSFIYASHHSPDEKDKCLNCYRFRRSKLIDINNIILSHSSTIFIKRNDFNSIEFDEEMGVGAIYGSAEESDFIMQGLKRNLSGYFLEDAIIFHDNFSDYASTSSEKSFNYALGFAHFHKKYISFFGYFRTFYLLIFKPIIGILVSSIFFNYHSLRVRYMNLYGILTYFYRILK